MLVEMLKARVWVCEQAACRKRQFERSLVFAGRMVYLPTPKQVEFELATENWATVKVDGVPIKQAKTILYGGAAGGAKSHAIRWLLIRLCLQIPGYSALLLRRNLTELKETHIQVVERQQKQIGAKLNKTDNVLNFPRGSRIKFGHLDDPKDVSKYLSTEYDKIAFDELVTFPEQESLLIMSRARTTKPDLIPGIIAGTNPGGPEAHWVKRRWLDKNLLPEEDITYDPDNYIYIPATVEDNPYLGPEYEIGLLRLPEELRRAYRMGDWDIFPGQFFSEWRRHRHVVAEDIREEGRWYLAIDWGYMAPGACLFIFVTNEGRAIVRHEYIFRQTIASEVASNITKYLKDYNIGRYNAVGDTDMWKPGTDTGESVAETFQRFGIYLKAADKDRENGWQRLRHWLRDAPDGAPWLQIHEDCKYLSRTLPALIMHDKFPEDIADGLEDHACDALRYFAMARPSPRQDSFTPQAPVDSPAWLLQQEKRDNTVRPIGQIA